LIGSILVVWGLVSRRDPCAKFYPPPHEGKIYPRFSKPSLAVLLSLLLLTFTAGPQIGEGGPADPFALYFSPFRPSCLACALAAPKAIYLFLDFLFPPLLFCPG